MSTVDDAACLVAHGRPAPDTATAPTVVAVFATGVATQLTHFARHLGWRTAVVDPRGVPDDVAALRTLGVADDDIARVRRPIGLDIGSRTPAEIALSTLAGLVADRAGRGGGFHDRR